MVKKRHIQASTTENGQLAKRGYRCIIDEPTVEAEVEGNAHMTRFCSLCFGLL